MVNWTRFRGPNGSGQGGSARVEDATILWKTPLPGAGHGSPVVWGSKAFVVDADDAKGQRHLHALDTKSGRVLWTRTLPFKPYHTHEFNTSASLTPALDAARVYALWPSDEAFVAVAWTHDGAEVWRRDFGAFPTQHGGASSPIVHKDLLLFAREPENAEGALHGLDAKTGAIRWSRPRPSGPAPYATPLLFQPSDGATQALFASTVHGLTALNPETGAPLWEMRDAYARLRCVSSPIQVGGLIVGTSGIGGGERRVMAVRPGPKPELVWQLTRGACYVPTPIAVDGRLYLWGDGGILTCVRPESGEALWSERIGGDFFGSPVCAGGALWNVSSKGELAMVDAGEKFALRRRIALEEPSHATPAVADGVLYVRTLRHLLAIG